MAKSDYDPFVSDFYYDTQLNNPSLTVSIHPNTVPIVDGSFNKLYWGAPDDEKIRNYYKSGKDRNSIYSRLVAKFVDLGTSDTKCLPRITDSAPTGTNSEAINWSAKYARRPLISAIMNEDFSIDTINAWTDAGIGGSIESTINGLRPYAPLMKKAGEILSKASAKAGEESFAGVVANGLNIAAGWLGKGANFLGEKLNNALRIQGSKVSYYSGSDVNLGNLTFKTTLFSDYTWDFRTKKYRFTPCTEKIEEILPYTMGNYVPFKVIDVFGTEDPGAALKTHFDTSGGDVLSMAKKFINDGTEVAGKTTTEFLQFCEKEKFLGWQTPPAGFEMMNRDIDYCNKGTVRLIFGNTYTIENLVIKNVNFTYSRVMCKNPIQDRDEEGNRILDKNGNSDQTTELHWKSYPLYVDVTITLQPVCSFTDKAFRRFVKFSGMGESFYNEDLEYQQLCENAGITNVNQIYYGKLTYKKKVKMEDGTEKWVDADGDTGIIGHADGDGGIQDELHQYQMELARDDTTVAVAGNSGVRGLPLSEESRTKTQEAIKKCGGGEMVITSTSRTSEDQVEAMITNLRKEGGIETQKSLYNGKPGSKVVEAFDPSLSNDENKVNMMAVMEEVGPQNVSRHITDEEGWSKLNVFDISASKVNKPEEVVSYIKKNYPGANAIYEPKNGCIHIELPQG